MPHARRLAVLLLLVPLLAGFAAGAEQDAASPLELAIASAESDLRQGLLEAADRDYREALFEAWLLVGMLESLERHGAPAREAIENAALFSVDAAPGLHALAAARLQMGDTAQAVDILERLAARDPKDGETRRLLARALAVNGQKAIARKRLAEAGALAREDPQLAFLVGTDLLWMKDVDAAAPFFAQVLKARPIPQSHVLIGRSYRDAGEYDRARAAFLAALQQDASVRRAHYYLGMCLLADARTGPDRLEKAMAEFREELKLAPDDPPANDQLGLALLEAGRPDEALAPLESAVRVQGRASYLFHLGRAQLALDRPALAATSLRRALEASQEHGGTDAELGKIHYQLGLALRKLGSADEAAGHLAEAGRLASAPAGGAEERDASDMGASSPLADLPLWQRQGLKRRAQAGLVRAYFNLGVLQAQGTTPRAAAAPAAERFLRATAFFERAAALDAAFPQLQSSLGVAYFNARQFAKATGPLQRAVAANPGDAGLTRILATSWLNTEDWDKAAALLADDPGREADPALQLAYGLALLRGGRAALAEKVLAGMLPAQAGSGELHELLAQAYESLGQKERAEQQRELARQAKGGR